MLWRKLNLYLLTWVGSPPSNQKQNFKDQGLHKSRCKRITVKVRPRLCPRSDDNSRVKYYFFFVNEVSLTSCPTPESSSSRPTIFRQESSTTTHPVFRRRTHWNSEFLVCDSKEDPHPYFYEVSSTRNGCYRTDRVSTRDKDKTK